MNQKISEDIRNKNLIEIIDLLEQKYKVNFSCDPKLISKTKLFTTSVEDVTLDVFLLALLKETNLNYHLIGNNIVLYYHNWGKDDPLSVKKNNDLVSKKKLKSNGHKVVPKHKSITVYDTVVYTVNDTVLHAVYDTLYIRHIDTVIVFDTIQLKIKPKPKRITLYRQNTPKYILGIQFGLFFPVEETKQYSLSIPGSDISNNTSTYYQAPSLGTGINLEKYFNNFFLQGGLNVALCRKKIQLNFTRHMHVTNELPTDSYTVVIDGDTIQRDVFENPVITQTDTIEMQSATSNSFYLEIPVKLGYDFRINPTLSVGAFGGFKWNLLIRENTKSQFPLASDGQGKLWGDYFSLLGGLRFSYYIQENLRFSTMAQYSYNLNQSQQNVIFLFAVSKSFF